MHMNGRSCALDSGDMTLLSNNNVSVILTIFIVRKASLFDCRYMFFACLRALCDESFSALRLTAKSWSILVIEHVKCRRGAHLPFLSREPVGEYTTERWRVANATPDLRLPSQRQGIAARWLVLTGWWQRHECVNNLPKVVTGSRFAPTFWFASPTIQSLHQQACRGHTFWSLHREAEKRNHYSFMNKSVNTQCNLTKFSTFILNEYHHRCCHFNF